MDKLLKVLVVVVLALSAAAVAVEVMLFLQREEIKGRTLKLMDGAVQIASHIEAPPETAVDLTVRDLPKVQLSREDLKNYYQVGADGKVVVENGVKKTDGPGTVDAKLKEVAAKAEVQYLRLNDTRVGLEQARTTLVTTSNTLVATESSLAETKDTLKKTETSLTAAKDDATQKADQIASLNQQKSALETDAEQKKAEMAKLVEKLSEKETSLEAAKRYVSKLERDISMMMNGSSETNAPPPGLQGQILVVNTNWNFVVVDVMEEGRVLPRTDLTIQRDNKLVGKVRISEVISDRRFAFGEILEDWQQLPVAKGDYVFY